MKNLITENIFGPPIFNNKIEIDNKKIEEYCYTLKSKNKGISLSNIGGWQSEQLQGSISELNGLFLSILQNVKEYAKILKVKEKYNFEISRLWVNINGFKDYNIPHIHSNSFISGVYYVKSNSEKSGKINFYHPAQFLMSCLWEEKYFETFDETNSVVWSYNPLQSYIYLFPSFLAHSVQPNLDTEDRISIAFNIGLN